MTDNDVFKALRCCTLGGCCHKCPLYNEGPDDPDECKSYLITNAYKQLNRMHKEWIPVGGWPPEPLPENNKDVLVFTGGEICMGRYNVDTYAWTDVSGTVYLAVTHWRPLPEPPKEDEV